MAFRTFIEVLIEIVAGYEALRQRLTNNKGMDTVQAFNGLDYDQNGVISAKDVSLIIISLVEAEF